MTGGHHRIVHLNFDRDDRDHGSSATIRAQAP
jgi:hypothetical protein